MPQFRITGQKLSHSFKPHFVGKLWLKKYAEGSQALDLYSSGVRHHGSPQSHSIFATALPIKPRAPAAARCRQAARYPCSWTNPA